VQGKKSGPEVSAQKYVQRLPGAQRVTVWDLEKRKLPERLLDQWFGRFKHPVR
jgi:hypothetical protein